MTMAAADSDRQRLNRDHDADADVDLVCPLTKVPRTTAKDDTHTLVLLQGMLRMNTSLCHLP